MQTGTAVRRKDQRESLRHQACLADKGGMLMIKFEDLLSDTERTIKEVCSFLELAYDAAMRTISGRTLYLD